MRFRSLVFFLFLGTCIAGCGIRSGKDHQNTSDPLHYWDDVTTTFIPSTECAGRIMPLKFRLLHVDYVKLRALLLQENAMQSTDTLLFPVPLPDGLTESYRLSPVQVMAPELAEKYPGIRTFSGVGVESPSDHIRLDIAPKGLSVMILSTRGTMMLDPYCQGDSVHVISYFKKDLPPDAKPEFEK